MKHVNNKIGTNFLQSMNIKWLKSLQINTQKCFFLIKFVFLWILTYFLFVLVIFYKKATFKFGKYQNEYIIGIFRHKNCNLKNDFILLRPTYILRFPHYLLRMILILLNERTTEWIPQKSTFEVLKKKRKKKMKHGN